MHLLVDVAKFFDWNLRHHSEVQDGDVSLPSHHGEQFRLVRQLQEEPNWVEIHVPDGDVDRMVEDHEAAVHAAQEGYTTTHEGGSAHGQEVTVPARSLPRKSRNKLIAEHLANTVLPQHAEAHHVTKVRVMSGYRNADGEEEDPTALERYLNRQLVEDAPEEDQPEEAPRSRGRRKAAETAEETPESE